MITVVIQAGGESRRMGRDKALVPFLGYPLIERVLARVRPLADELLITTNHPAEFRFLKVPLITDRIPNRGALGGLFTALSTARNPLVAVVACDMPFVNPEILVAASDLLHKNKIDAVIPKTAQGAEPFHAVYRAQTCLPAIEAALHKNQWRADAWFPAIHVLFLSSEEIYRFDPLGLAFFNINTNEDLVQAECLAQEYDLHLSKTRGLPGKRT
jgi:molybdopterin-guanine dinucleotide biosynthesis protein A